MRLHFTLRKALALNFILVAVLPLLVGGLAGIKIISRTLETEISERNSQLAAALVDETTAFLDDSIGILQLVHDRIAHTRKDGKTPPPDDFLRLLRGRFDAFERIAVVDREGRIRHIVPPQPEKSNTDFSGQPFFRDALATGHLAISETFVSEATGFPTVGIAVPGKAGLVVGYLNLATLARRAGNITIGRSGQAVVFDRFGAIIVHPERHFVTERMNLKNMAPVREALAGRTGTFRYSFLGVPRIGSTAVIARTGWIVLACRSEKKAFAPVAVLRNILFASLIAIFLLVLVLAVFVMKKPLGAITGLVAAAGKIAGGDYHFEDVPESYPEIDALATGFRGMAEEVASRENALAKAEERFRRLVENSFDGIFLHDGKKILFVNSRLCEMVGYEEKELTGKGFTALLSPEYRAIALERTHLRFEGKSAPRRYNVQMIRRDGSLLDVEVSAGAVRMDDKQAIQIWVRDISEQKRLEEERALSEKRLGELYDSVSDLIYTQDIEGRFTSVNKAIAGLFDLTSAEMVGMKASAFMKVELAPFFETEYLGKLKEQGHYEGITAYIAGDNHKFYIDYRSVLVRPPHGEPYISGIGRDVTSQIMAQRKVREASQRMQAVLDASPNPIVAYDVAGNVTLVNKSFTDVFGWTFEELAGRSVPFVPEDQKEKTMQAVRDLFSGKISGVGTLETARLTKAGDRRDIIVSATLISSSEGKPAGMVVSFTDITERKKMEAVLLQSQKMEAVGVLAGGIAHDFNNLLMGIQGNVSLSLLSRDMNDGLRRNMENIESLVNRGATLTRQLLGFARGGKYEVKTYNICDILEVESALFGDTHKDIVIERNPAPDLWKVDVDRAQVEQVFMNLFVNAGQAMPKGGQLTLEAENVMIDDASQRMFYIRPGRYVRVSVTDTGIGMDEKTKSRIFEPFFTTKEPGKGTGMGLASVYGIVKNHGGFINVYSEPGQGTSFHVYFPASEAVVAEEKTESAAKDSLIYGEGTILLVDDEAMIVDVGKDMLEMMGYRVITASGGKEAIEKFAVVQNKAGEVDRIDLVIQDMIMPGIGGGELFDRLRELDPDVKVILSSGYSLNDQARDILSRGCRGFIQKPFSMEALSRKVHEVLK